MNTYKTLYTTAQEEYIVQKSRFICHAAPVSSTEDALAYLEEIRKEHRSASHNCFAYIIGQNKGIIRYSDDGEPSGTAGKPIAEVMIAKDVVDSIVVITRYFGGILLGAGGLVRAYAHSAALALDTAGICEMHETARRSLNITYPLWDRVDHALKALPVIVEKIDYAANITVSFLVREGDDTWIIMELMKITDGKMESDKEQTLFYHPWGSKEKA
ncbi:MAG TPA: YigZ family protein [Candidatus Limiplasma sp.]|nr:YigZ family protein [Candidatus Limiplasma sp.]